MGVRGAAENTWWGTSGADHRSVDWKVCTSAHIEISRTNCGLLKAVGCWSHQSLSMWNVFQHNNHHLNLLFIVHFGSRSPSWWLRWALIFQGWSASAGPAGAFAESNFVHDATVWSYYLVVAPNRNWLDLMVPVLVHSHRHSGKLALTTASLSSVKRIRLWGPWWNPSINRNVSMRSFGLQALMHEDSVMKDVC